MAAWGEDFTTLRKPGFGQAEPNGEKNSCCHSGIAEKLQIRSVLRKLLVTQDAEPRRSKTPH